MNIKLLATQLELFHAIFDKSVDAIVIVDENGLVRYWSKSAEKLFGFTAKEIFGAEFNERVTPLRFRDQVRAELQVFQETGRNPVVGRILEALVLTSRGDEIWVDMSLTDIRVDEKRWLLAIIRDAESRKEREAELERAATTDSLSGLANRSGFQFQLEKNLGADVALAILDVDQFKQINDQHGHPIGDEAIKHVSTVLCDVFPNAICVARLGGDEFGVLLAGHSRPELRTRFEELLHCVATSEYSNRELSLTASIGVAQSVPGSTPRSLLTAADQAMYRSKKAGRNCVTVTEDEV